VPGGDPEDTSPLVRGSGVDVMIIVKLNYEVAAAQV
jgi:hypothetical protein